jgi:hypothetical protein
MLDEWRTYTTTASAFTFSADGKYLMTTGDRGLALWDWKTGRRLAELRHWQGRYAGAFTPDNKFFVNRYAKSIMVWELRNLDDPAK